MCAASSVYVHLPPIGPFVSHFQHSTDQKGTEAFENVARHALQDPPENLPPPLPDPAPPCLHPPRSLCHQLPWHLPRQLPWRIAVVLIQGEREISGWRESCSEI